MNRRVARRLLVATLCSWMFAPLRGAVPAVATGEDGAALIADHALLQALSEGNKSKLVVLLDRDFTWIDASGKNLNRTQVLDTPPTVSNADIEPQVRIYGQAAIAKANRGKMQVLRVWVKREPGWRILLYQEVRQVEKSEPAATGEANARECENPCKSIPFQPETQSEREAIDSWQGVMRAMAASDAAAYAPLIADEFTATDTHHDAPYSKAERLAQIEKQKRAGTKSMPPALLSARMFDLGETVMMIAREQRPDAKAYFNTRMWIKRQERWQMLFSFNTRIDVGSDFQK